MFVNVRTQQEACKYQDAKNRLRGKHLAPATQGCDHQRGRPKIEDRSQHHSRDLGLAQQTPAERVPPETVVEVAPSVSLYLANPVSPSDLLATVQWMASQGVQVINHSVGWYWDGPGDGTSIYSNSPLKAVDAAAAAGVVWVNSAGNSNQRTWTGSYVDANANGFMEFSPGVETNDISLVAGNTVIVQARWEDTWGSASRNLDLLLYDSAGTTLLASSTDPQSEAAGNNPFEILSYTAPTSGTYRIAIRRASVTVPAWVEVQVFAGTGAPLSIPVSGHSITTPADSFNPGMLTVGAARWDTTSTIEPYSSQGPTRDNRVKPDIVGADCADTATYGAYAVTGGFCGTSQASPHVAGLAALLRQGYPADSAAQIASRLKSWALARGTVPNNTWGSGFASLTTITGKAVFTQQPSAGTAGAPLPTQPVVTMKDAVGATLTSDNSTVVTLSGRLYVSADQTQGGLAVVGLPPLPMGSTYQIWFVRPDQGRASGGLVVADQRGSALVKVTIPGPLSEFAGVGITGEPAGGSTTPTSQDVLAGPLYER